MQIRRASHLLTVLIAAASVAFDAGAAGANEERTLQRVASFDHQVTGVTVSPTGRIFVNFPRWTEDAPVSVGEVSKDGHVQPYPDAAWNAWRNLKAAEMTVSDHFVCVQSVVADRQGNLWVVDAGAPANEKTLPDAPKLVKIELAGNRVTKVIPVPGDVALQGTYLNDLRVSPDGHTGYITDSGTRGALIVVDLESGKSWRALDGHPTTQVDKTVKVMLDGKPLLRPDQRQPTFAADGIALSNDGKTLYWQALTGKTLYSIPTDRLARDVADSERGSAVVTVADTQVTDGIWMSAAGMLYVTSPTDYSIKRLAGDRLETVMSDRRLRWPDTFSEGPDGQLYVTASHIADSAWFKPGAAPAVKTELYRFKPAAGGR